MRKHWIKIIAVLGVLLIVTLLTARYYVAVAKNAKSTVAQANASQALSPANECTQCHEMKPEVLTWQISTHNKFACTVCHVNKKASDYVAKHQSQSFSFPIKTNEAIANSVCLECHTSNRKTSPTGDLKIPHEKHIDAGLLCVTCHFGVVHGKIAERDLSGVVDVNDFDSWNLEIAKKVATPAYIMPSMWTCIDCHKKANITRQCGACHTTIPALPTHDRPEWKSDHGKAARQDIAVCINCHATPDQPNFVALSTGDKAADFARAQVFCYTCHLQRPQMHEKSMIPIHPKLIAKREGSTLGCLTCHNANQPQPEEKVTKFYCNQCHWDKIEEPVPKPKG